MLTITLGLDFGTSKVGVAKGIGKVAQPLVILANKGDIFSQISQLVALHRVAKVIVGISEGKTAQQTQQFIDRLRTKLCVPVLSFDETLSTKQALKIIGQARGQRPRQDDAIAAAVMLQEWLDSTP